MKKILIASLCLLLVCGSYTVAKENKVSYVNASSTVTRDLEPNYAQIHISVDTKAKVAEDASRRNADISSEVVKNVKALIDSKKGDMIETLDYNVSPQYSYTNGKSTLTGYSVSNTVKVKIRDVKSVSAVIDEAMKSGANRVSGLEFGYDDEGLVCNELYAKATRNAYSQAQSVAKALGSEVTGARSINTSCSLEGQHNGMRYYRAMDGAVGANGAATPIEAKTLKVTATVSGNFNIK